MTDIKYDQVSHVDIGFDDAHIDNYVGITNVVFFAEKVISPDGDLVDPLAMINSIIPGGVHQNHKYWELTLQLDTNWYEDSGTPENYWAYNEQTETLVAGSRAIKDILANSPIEYFVVHIKKHDGTLLKYTYADEDTDILWCISEVSEISNETGVRRQTTTFKFICLQEKVEGVGAAVGVDAGEGAGKIKRIQSVGTNSDTTTNVLSFRDEFVMKMTPQFIPNTYKGVGLKQDEKYRRLTVVLDSETDVFDEMLTIESAQIAAATEFEVVFVMDDAAGTTEKWAYTVANTYMSKREEGKADDTSGRNTTEYHFITYGAKTVTQT